MSGLIGRRGLLAALIALPVGAAAAWAFVTRKREGVDEIVRKALPDAVIPDTTISAFLADFELEQPRDPNAPPAEVLKEYANALIQAFSANEDEKRKIVTAFVMGSSYFRQRGGPDEPIVWLGLPALCDNPFARF